MAVDGGKTKAGIQVASLTGVAATRANNEDSYLYWEPDTYEEFQRKGRLAIVADGMGGYEGGQEASRLAVETIVDRYRAAGIEPQAALLVGFQAAHDTIRNFAEEHPEFYGMGTTCTAIAIQGRRMCYA